MARCSKCGSETGTRHRYCREHQAEAMRKKRARLLKDAHVEGEKAADTILGTARLIEYATARRAYLRALVRKISRNIK